MSIEWKQTGLTGSKRRRTDNGVEQIDAEKLSGHMANAGGSIIDLLGMGHQQTSLRVIDNTIYFCAEVNRATILSLTTELKTMSNKLMDVAMKNNNKPADIYLNIRSFGGSVFDAFAAIDAILNCPVDVITVIDGYAASAGTMMSIVGKRRYMTKHSMMLVHQLSGGMWGKFSEMEDDMENNKELMTIIKGLYIEFAEIPKKQLDKILTHDLWWNSETCLKYGLIDEIITPETFKHMR
ncbi:MAG: hypothetical protein Faunusvirus15_2 [Faunusvirus sp.]|jgi:ATP-dependent Clp protease protease subunit|uniref:ATP-dependent Clp protease proteolytic subunit n=1 Tax=Faunusvirus sp. TaxID=2487766 RepID=A0A3G4ZZL2_9VIRU|nr:MAG: hypothetical protein Faunusvirus15_2 [Faunusvirus sp.]